MSDNLSRMQIIAVTACLLWGNISLLSSLGNYLGRHIWLATLIAAAAAALICFALDRWLLSAAASRLREQGPGSFVAGCGLIYAILFTAVLTAAAVQLWQAWSVSEMPFALYALLMTLVMLYGGMRGGYMVPARLSVLSVFFLVLMAVVDSLLLLPGMRPARLLPLAGVELSALLPAALLQSLVLISGLPLLLFLLPRAADIKQARLGIRYGFILALSYMLLMELRNVLLLGDLLMLDRYPLLRALKMVELGIGLSRMEYFGMLALLGITINAGMLALSAAQICWRRLAAVSAPKDAAAEAENH